MWSFAGRFCVWPARDAAAFLFVFFKERLEFLDDFRAFTVEVLVFGRILAEVVEFAGELMRNVTALLLDPINVWRAHVSRVIGRDITLALVIGKDEEEVRWAGLSGRTAKEEHDAPDEKPHYRCELHLSTTAWDY